MADREKVIKGLECCTAYYINNDLTGHERCPYNGRNGGDGCNKLYADALALLKEQEAVKIEVKKINGSGRCGRCPNCLMELNEMDYPNYCGFCGRSVKWE